MKFTLSWLHDHLDTQAPLDAILATLTRIGLEVEGVANPGAALAAFRVARVLSAEPHPQADKLQVLSVDAGDGPRQVVCGAPNARAGMVGVFGAPGAYVPGSGITLKVAAIRGVESRGMLCSVRELELGEEHDGIIELPADAPVGASFPDYAGLNDPVIDVAITPNRQDCMGVRGIARDLAAAGVGTLRPLVVPTAIAVEAGSRIGESVGSIARFENPATGANLALPRHAGLDPASMRATRHQPDARGERLAWTPDQVRGDEGVSEGARRGGEGVVVAKGPAVATDDPEGCPAFFAQGVAGVVNGKAPEWMQRRLQAIGQKPISALVDITNYLMIDLGRPLHVYDRAKLTGALVARKARAGEQVLALNGKTYVLAESDTVIADDAQVHDIGGIMGGEDSGVSDATTDVLIECAYFTPEHIARTGQRLNLTSDARGRFERGVDPAFLDDGLAIAVRMVLDLCGGTPGGVTRAGEAPVAMKTFGYDPTLAARLGGLAVAAPRQRFILEALGFAIDDDWRVTPPSWRRDIDGPADLVEEVVRIEGIDTVPSTPLPRAQGVARPTATPEQKVERKVRRSAAARGSHEAVTWSFISPAHAAVFGGGAWTLANPISEDMKVMRPSLLPGLLAAARRNLGRGAAGVRLFEIGRRYLADGDARPDERATLTLVLAGERGARGWQAGKAGRFDAFDAKAEALALLEAARAPVANLQVMQGAGEAYHPGQSATLRLGPKVVLANFGMLHPGVCKAFDIDGDVAAVELFLDALPARRSGGFMRPAFAPPALQPVRRDFAFVVPAALAADALVRAVKGADKAAIVDARLFDVFERDGERSMAVEVTLQPADRSFTDAELKAAADKVVAAAAKLGAVLRG